MNRAQRQRERQRKRTARDNTRHNQHNENLCSQNPPISKEYHPSQLTVLVGDSSTEIPDDIIVVALNLMKSACESTIQPFIGYFLPAEIAFAMSTNQQNAGLLCKQSLPDGVFSINIHPLQGHWVTSCYYPSTNSIHVYDSLMSQNHLEQVLPQLRIIYGQHKTCDIQYKQVTQQGAEPLCGVMAIAFAFTCFQGKDPSTINYNTALARQHLQYCITEGKVLQFPEIQHPEFTVSDSTVYDNNMHPSLAKYFSDQQARATQHKLLISSTNTGQPEHTSLFTAAKANIKKRKIEHEINQKTQQKRANDKKQRKLIIELEKAFVKQQTRERVANIRKRKTEQEKATEKELTRKRVANIRKRKSEQERAKENKERKERVANTRKHRSEQEKAKENSETKERVANIRKRKSEQEKAKENKETKERVANIRKHKSEQEKAKENKERKERIATTRKRKSEQEKAKENLETKERVANIRKRKSEQDKAKENKETKERVANIRKRKSEQDKAKENKETKERVANIRKRKSEQEKAKENKETKERVANIRNRKSEQEKSRENKERKKRIADIRKCKSEQEKAKENKETKERVANIRKCKNEQEKANEKQQTRDRIHNIRQRQQENSVDMFHKECLNGPTFACVSCKRWMYRAMVKKFKLTKYTKLDQSLLNKSISVATNTDDFICKTCDWHLCRNKMPPQCQNNQLLLEEQPQELKLLCDLETQLIAQRIPFMKIVNLVRDAQKGIHGAVVNVPTDLSKVCVLLPPTISQCGIVSLKLKRKLSYHGHVTHQTIKPESVIKALQYLIKNNEHYKNVVCNDVWIKDNETQNPDMWSLLCEENLNSDSRELIAEQINNRTNNSIPPLQQNDNDTDNVILPPQQKDSDTENVILPPQQNNSDTDYVILPPQQNDNDTDNVILPPQQKDNDTDNVILPPQQNNSDTDNVILLPQQNNSDTDNVILPPQQNDNDTDNVILSPQQNDNDTDVILPPQQNNNDTGNVILSPQQNDNDTDNVILPPQQNDSDTDNDSDEELEHPIPAVEYDTCLQQPEGKIYSIAPGEGKHPLSLFQDEDAEVLAFPKLFPQGKYGYNVKRTTPLTRKKYFNARLMNKDNRFAESSQYLFFAQYLTEAHEIQQNINIALRKKKPSMLDGRNISKKGIIDKEQIQRIISHDEGFKVLSSVRGSPAYWQKMQYDCLAKIRQLGPYTFCCTFSVAEFRWTEILQILGKQFGEQLTEEQIHAMDFETKTNWFKRNPVTVARHIDYMFQKMFHGVVIGPPHSIGQILNYDLKKEFQGRGRVHFHVALHVKDAPRLGENTDDEITRFVDQHISCRIPDQEQEQEFHNQVTQLQRHSHSRTCKKKNTSCRFHFPKPPSPKTVIAKPPDDETDPVQTKRAEHILKAVHDAMLNWNAAEPLLLSSLLAQVKVTQEDYTVALRLSSKRHTVVLRREPDEAFINNYNPTFLKAWRANTDIQFILDTYPCVMYVTSYLCKSERTMSQLLYQASKECSKKDLSIKYRLSVLCNVFSPIVKSLQMKPFIVFCPSLFAIAIHRLYLYQQTYQVNGHVYYEVTKSWSHYLMTAVMFSKSPYFKNMLQDRSH